MVNRLLLWAAGSSRLEHAVANNRLLVKTVHRFVAGAQLSDAVSAAVDLNTGGSAPSSTFSARGSRISPVLARRPGSIGRLWRLSPNVGSTRPSR
jgi:hypothetical protein